MAVTGLKLYEGFRILKTELRFIRQLLSLHCQILLNKQKNYFKSEGENTVKQ